MSTDRKVFPLPAGERRHWNCNPVLLNSNWGWPHFGSQAVCVNDSMRTSHSLNTVFLFFFKTALILWCSLWCPWKTSASELYLRFLEEWVVRIHMAMILSRKVKFSTLWVTTSHHLYWRKFTRGSLQVGAIDLSRVRGTSKQGLVCSLFGLTFLWQNHK